MRDLPSGPTLLGLARDILLNDLLPLLPPESRLDARLVANSMAIAEREAAAGEGPEQEIRHALEGLYTDARLTHPAPKKCPVTDPPPPNPSGWAPPSPAVRERGSAVELVPYRPSPALRERVSTPDRSPGETGEGCSDALRRFARDLRAGSFGGSERQARDILWRLTIGKLRLANPRFLAANGFR